jgi:Ca2+-binding EF-hand superfamily protein
MTGSTLMNETEFFQWVKRIQALRPPPEQTSGSSADEEAGLDLVAAFRVFDRDKNGFITKVNFQLVIHWS